MSPTIIHWQLPGRHGKQTQTSIPWPLVAGTGRQWRQARRGGETPTAVLVVASLQVAARFYLVTRPLVASRLSYRWGSVRSHHCPRCGHLSRSSSLRAPAWVSVNPTAHSCGNICKASTLAYSSSPLSESLVTPSAAVFSDDNYDIALLMWQSCHARKARAHKYVPCFNIFHCILNMYFFRNILHSYLLVLNSMAVNMRTLKFRKKDFRLWHPSKIC